MYDTDSENKFKDAAKYFSDDQVKESSDQPSDNRI